MQEYRLKFYLNAVHAIEINEILGQSHPHTWEISLDVMKSEDSFVMFSRIEKAVEELLFPYQDKNMNEVEPFTSLNPTLENVSMFFKEKLEQLLIDMGWILLRLEVSETPTRTYTIDLHQQENRPEAESLDAEPLTQIAQSAAVDMVQAKLKARGDTERAAVAVAERLEMRTEDSGLLPPGEIAQEKKPGFFRRLLGRRPR